MIIGKIIRQQLVWSCPRRAAHYRHSKTRGSDTTVDLTPEQELVSYPVRSESGSVKGVSVVHDIPVDASKCKQPRRDHLLRPRWPKEFIIEPVIQGKYGLVALESDRLRGKPVEASKLLMNKILRKDTDGIWIRFYPEYPWSVRPSNTKRGGGKSKIDHYLDIVLAGRVLFEFDGDMTTAKIVHHEVQKEIEIAMMLVKGSDHRFPSKMTDIGGRDRYGWPKYQYKIEYADGRIEPYSWPEKFHDHYMKDWTYKNFHLDYSHNKNKCFGNDRLREKFGNPY